MIRSPRARPRWLFAVAALAIVVIVGAADYWAPHEILLSSFYLVAVVLAVWGVGRAFGWLVSALSVGTSLAGDFAAGATDPRTFAPAWNAAIVFAIYGVVVELLSRLRTLHRDLEERVRVRTVALQVEMAERERLQREILDAADRERRRVGRDLHDSLGQHLTGIALAGQVLQEKLASRAVPESDDAARIVSLVEEGVEQTRRLARGLDPVEIENGGLAEGLRELARLTSELAPVRCDCRLEEPVTIADGMTATHLYHIAQEAITNAVKHGQARRILVRLDRAPGGVRLTVLDDGRGIGSRPPGGPGMGLRIMAHRAAVIGGTFEARERRSGGTTVVCEAPIP